MGHQIRSYVLDQSRIKDLRTGVEIADTGRRCSMATSIRFSRRA
jgi:protein subunit release factor B